MIPSSMLAIGIARPGGPEVLRLEERPVPVPAATQVLVRVGAAGVNRHDCFQRLRGSPPPGATDIPGLEVAGEIVAIGPEVRDQAVGARVCALVNGGGYAEYCVAESALALPVPTGFGWLQAAALPEALFTTWFNVFELAGLARGEWLLVHGGASGVGTAAIQLARARGARVIVTAGNDDKCNACLRLGAEAAINYHALDFVEEVARITDGRGVDVILDMAGGAYAERNLHAIAFDGRVIHLTTRGVPGFTAPLDLILRRRARITGSLLRPLVLERKARVAHALVEQVWPLLGRGIDPVIDSAHALVDARRAHERIESGAHIGKIMLSIRPD